MIFAATVAGVENDWFLDDFGNIRGKCGPIPNRRGAEYDL
jgi:hypothetical protein